MTIKVTVTNSDSRESAVISVREMSSSNAPGATDVQQGPTKELKGGESAEVYVHGSQYLLVREVKQ
jgi:hypothetical protein